MNVEVKKVAQPPMDHSQETVMLSDATFIERYQKIIALMRENDISTLVVYADKEHGSNFEYLTGFIPRFEEALQIITLDGISTLMLGNENFNKIRYSVIKSKEILVPLFSLPNQPMNDFIPFIEYLNEVNINVNGKIGFVDWKLLNSGINTDSFVTAIPNFIIDAFKQKFGIEKLVNATHVYINPGYGARVTNNSNEIAKYEYGASLASDALLSAYNKLQEGISELEVGNALNRDGQYQSVVTISAFGERFKNANIYPTNRELETGDRIAITVGYKGGLSSRSGYAVKSIEELEKVDPGYFDNVVIPYFKAYNFWLDTVRIGLNGGDFFDLFNQNYPQETFGWKLNPGHLTSDEEWLASPFYKDSKATVKSGMIFQVDFIPQQPPHQGVSAESTVAIADKTLIEDIKGNYPQLWKRIQSRKKYLAEELNILLHESLLPLSGTLAYLRPFMLNKELALAIKI